jgi:Cft2 family RNA processing exonuclease
MTTLECLAYGTGHAQEGVCLQVQIGPYQIMLDCGLRDLSGLQQVPDLVICSHAHGDHARGLQALHQAFPQLPIYASEATTQLLPLNWLEDAEAENRPAFCQALPWGTPIGLLANLTIELFPAGHIPGAAALLLTYSPAGGQAQRLFYSGDCFLSNGRLAEGLRLEALRSVRPDVMIVEGSYGSRRYPRRRQQENQLMERLLAAIGAGQSVLLPVPTMGLGQELLMLLRSHHSFTGRALDIWVDGTIAAGCDVYLDLLAHLPVTIQNFAKHQPLFWDDRIGPYVRRLRYEQRPELGRSGDAPSIVLTGARANLQDLCHQGRWLILLPEQGHHQGDWLAEDVQPMAELAPSLAPQITVETYRLAEHCDGASTTQLIHNLRPQHVMFVHGDPADLADLAGLDELSSRYQLHVPSNGQKVGFPIGATFLQPAAPETRYEGEVNESEGLAQIALPDSIVTDRRWQALADTGLVEARWQGDELVLRGMSQRMLAQGQNPGDGPNCYHCRYYRGQHCRQPQSPLFNFRVTPIGLCSAFEST